MSGTVEDEVVRMRFDNNAFERGVAATLSSLGKLRTSLNFSGADKGIDNVQNKVNKFSMNPMASGIEGISKKFLALSTVALTALSNITNRVLNAGLSMAKSFTIQPLVDGFHEYETQLNSVQTILANTGLKGADGMAQVNGALNQLNTYSDKTIYNFSEMARNIGTFTAAGVKLAPATSAIKGIANVAALSGSNSQQASTAMYQLSQAIANNKVGLQDWNSVVNAGMGGKVFQSALFNVAKMKGTLKGVKANETFDQWTKAGNSFRNSLQQGWITGDVLTSTLSQFTGDLTDAQLKSQGYNATQIKQIQEQAKVAADAATKVKTFTQLVGTLKEAVGSGWSQTFLTIFGNFDEAKTLWTGVSNTLGGMISKSSKARNAVLGDWKKLGGRTQLIKGVQAAFTALGSVLTPIKNAFRDIFPAKTGKDLYDLTVRFANFMKSLKLGPQTAENLRRTFAGVFALFHIGKEVVSGIFHALFDLFGVVHQGTGSFLSFTGSIGDWLVALDRAITEGNGLNDFFNGIVDALSVPLTLLVSFKNLLFGLFDGWHQDDANGISDSLHLIGDRLSNISQSVSPKIRSAFSTIGDTIHKVVSGISDQFGNLGDAIANSLKSGNFGPVLQVIQTGLLGGILLLVKRFFAQGINVDIGGGIFKEVKSTFGALTGSMKAMQTQIKAKTLLLIAGAIGILTASVVALSLIDEAALTKALKAMAIGFGQLLGSMAILTKISGSAGFLKVPIIAGSMTLLAGSVLLLTVAVRNLAGLSWDELKKGLTGVAALLAMISVAVIPLSKNSKGMIQVGIGLTAIGVAMNILFLAVKGFSTLNWTELGKGLAAVAGSLAAIAAGMQLMPKNLAALGFGLLEISIALNAIYLAVKSFSSMDWKTMGKGLAGVGGALVAIAIGMHLMPKGMIAQSAALLLVSLALQGISAAVAKMGRLKWETIGKGLATLAGVLVTLALALKAMTGSLSGAASLYIVSAALKVLTPVLTTLGKTPWQVIAIGLGYIAAAFVTFGLAGLALAPVTPILLALSLAFIGFGAALALAGVGIAGIGKGLALLASAGSKAVKVLADVLTTFVKQIPGLAVGLAKGLVQFLSVLGKNAPKIGKAISAIVAMILKVLVDNIPKIVNAAVKLILSLLKAITDAMPKFIKAAADLIVAFLQGIGDQLPKVIDAGFKLVINFLNGLADAIRNNMGQVIKAMGNVGLAIVQGLWDGISSLLGWVWGKITGFFSWLWDKIKGFFGVHSPSTLFAGLGKNLIQGLWNGITGAASWLWSMIQGFFSWLWGKITAAISGVWRFGKSIVTSLWNGISGAIGWLWDRVAGFFGSLWKKFTDFAGRIWDVGTSIIDNLWNGITGAAKWLWDRITGFFSSMMKRIGDILHGIYDLGRNLIQSLVDGMASRWGEIHDKGDAVFEGVLGGIRSALGIGSPSKYTTYYGQMLIEGLIRGIGKLASRAVRHAGRFGKNIVDTLSSSLNAPNLIDINPTITPVLDLSNVQKDANRIPSMLGTSPLRVDTSYGAAASISADRRQQTKDAQPMDEGPTATKVVKYEQNNYSPVALSAIDIYRATKNQLSQVERALSNE